MAFSRVLLFLQIRLVFGSNYGYVEWSDNDKDAEIHAKIPTLPTRAENINKEEPLLLQPTSSYPGRAAEEKTEEEEEDVTRAVTAFLHTGDASALRRANCSRRYELRSLGHDGGGASRVTTHHRSLRGALDTVAHAANFLNALLQANKSRETSHSVRRDVQWYRALARSIVETNPTIHRAVVTFHADAQQTPPGPHVILQATRTERDVVLQDLSGSARHHAHGGTAEHEWFNRLREQERPQRRRGASASGPDVVGVSNGYFLDRGQVRWSAPYLECERGGFVPFWLLTLSAGFYSLRTDSAPKLRGVVRVDVSLQDVDIDQCSSTGWFSGTHRCNLTSMECVPVAGRGFVLDQYRCRCRAGFHHPGRVALNGATRLERGPHSEDPSEASSACLPCREGCRFCRDDTPCLVQAAGGLRRALAFFQGLCVLLVPVGMATVYHCRRNKRIRASGLLLLEAILFGALLLYFPVLILYFHPSVVLCVLLRWVRLLGFATAYGTIILKLYRVLKVFLSRTAQRTPYMTSWRVLRLLGVILVVVLWFLVAWTSAVCQNQNQNQDQDQDRDRRRRWALIDTGRTPDGRQFSMCLLDRWDHMMAVAEFLFLLWGVYLCLAVRCVPTAFHEPRYLGVAIYNELLLSAIFHAIRFSLAPGLHPDWMLMLFFAHTHLTVTVTLALLLVPKFLWAGPQARDDMATEAYEEELDLNRSGSCLNNSITSACSEHSLDREDIRDELKRLYGQLEVYKHKKMLANNPHLPKKRSSKKGLGRSLMKRIAELPESMHAHVHVHRQTSREDGGAEHGGSRGTLRRNAPDPAHAAKNHQRQDSLKDKVLGLARSHSYDHVCDQGEGAEPQGGGGGGGGEAGDDKTAPAGDGSLLGSLIGRRQQHGKKSPEAPPRTAAAAAAEESLPLACSGKSVSAHNLTADGKRPALLRAAIMQKSLSVISSANKMLSNRTPAPGRDVLSEAEEEEAPPERYPYPPKMIVSQSVECARTAAGKTGIMRAAAASGSQPSVLYDLTEVCPWEAEDTPPAPPPDSRAQKHVSIAPGETTTTGARRRGSGSGAAKKRASAQSPGDRRRSRDKGGGEREEAARKPRPSLPLRPEVCPWDFDEPPAPALGGGDSDSLSPDRVRRKKSVTPTDGRPRPLRADHSRSTGSLLQPGLTSELRPWDQEPPPPAATAAPASPAPHPRGKRRSSGASKERGERGGGGRDREEEKSRLKSKERRCSGSERRRVSQSSDGAASATPPGGRRRSSTRCAGEAGEGGEGAGGRRAEACPWEGQPLPSPRTTVAAAHQAAESDPPTHAAAPAPEKKTDSAPGGPAAISAAKMADVCPWDFEETDSGKKA